METHNIPVTVEKWITTIPESVPRALVIAMLKTLSIREGFTHLTALHEALLQIQYLIPFIKQVHLSNKAHWQSWLNHLPDILATISIDDVVQKKFESMTPKFGKVTGMNKEEYPLIYFLITHCDDPERENQFILPKATLVALSWLEQVGEEEVEFDVDLLCGHIRLGQAKNRDSSNTYNRLPVVNQPDAVPLVVEALIATELKHPRSLEFALKNFRRVKELSESYAITLIAYSLVLLQSRQVEITQHYLDNLKLGSSRQQFEQQQLSLSLFKTPSNRVVRNFIISTPRPSTENSNTKGLAPEQHIVTVQPRVQHNTALPSMGAQQMEVRYANFATIMERQCLKWDWNQLNEYEVNVLMNAILQVNERDSETLKKGAMLAWLRVMTAQSLSRIFASTLNRNRQPYDVFYHSGTWAHFIARPPHAFKPKTWEQASQLVDHVQHVELPLPTPYPLGYQDLLDQIQHRGHLINTLGDLLGMEVNEGDACVQQFLKTHRTRKARLYPERLKKVLGNTLMQLTGDKVLTHYLSTLPEAMSPIGVYYLAYGLQKTQHIYTCATNQIYEGV